MLPWMALDAKVRGEEKVRTLIQASLWAREIDFHAVFQKTKSPTLSTLYNQRMDGTVANKTKIIAADGNLFQRILVAQRLLLIQMGS